MNYKKVPKEEFKNATTSLSDSCPKLTCASYAFLDKCFAIEGLVLG